MNERFKFRIWDKKMNKYSGSLNYINCKTGELEQLNIPDGMYPTDDRFIIEQCTGLKDKNGKSIYEGDIITRKGMYRKVFWIDGEGGFGYEPSTVFVALQSKTCKIAGNIHENPELLERIEE